MINKNELGTINIKDKAIKEIVQIAVKKTKFVRPAKKDLSFIEISSRSNKLILNVNVKIKEGKDILKISSIVQKNITDAIVDFTSAKISNLKVSITDFYN